VDARLSQLTSVVRLKIKGREISNRFYIFLHCPYLSSLLNGKQEKLKWLETVSSTYILMGRYDHSLSLDASIMVSKNCPVTGEHVVIIFVTQ